MSYNQALTVFSPDGHLIQVEFAMEAVKRGATCIGVRGKESIVLAVERKTATQLQDSRTVKKILQIDDNIFLAFAGLTADARVLANRARIECQSFRLNYEDRVEVDYLTKYIAHTQQRYTQRGGYRPFGVSCIIAGVDETDGKPSLYMTDPSGNYAAWKAVACGHNQKTAREFFEKNYQEEADRAGTLRVAVRALLEVVDQGAKNIEVAELRAGESRFLPEDELTQLVKEIEKEREEEEKAKKRGKE
eukprot:TRINITY_DN56185_c0_g1_i1.p2 TRINITY_DN56185_c0_g1~~TRINITY_DN56185_c0_g1_i1.p2  ORF type:complete len:276 (+),score=129.40 TRINITY_DN56185_c0_g1_i1:89-829(+)